MKISSRELRSRGYRHVKFGPGGTYREFRKNRVKVRIHPNRTVLSIRLVH